MTPRRRGRWLLLWLGALLALCVAWAFLVEPQRLQLRHVRLPLPGLRHPLRVFVLADVDYPSSARRERKVLEAAQAFRPDLVLVAGDLLDRVENVQRPETAAAAARWVSRMGPRAFLAAGEEESPSTAKLAQAWQRLGVLLLSNEARTLRIGDEEIDLYVADRRLDAPPWALSREGARWCAVQGGRYVHGFLYSSESRNWLGTETSLVFRTDADETYLDVHLGWAPGRGASPGEGFKVGRFEEEPAFRLAHGNARVATGYTPRPGVWTRARLRLQAEADRTVFQVRFWEDGHPEPGTWQGELTVPGPPRPLPGRFAVGSRNGGRAVADLEVKDLAGRLLDREGFSDLEAFRARWRDTSVLEQWQRGRDPRVPAILLAHHPDIVLDALRAGGSLPDLVLAGHTHGGQIRLPFLGTVFTSTALGRKYDAGLFEVGGVPLYITAGVGTSIVPARFLAPPDVVLLELEPVEAQAGLNGAPPPAARPRSLPCSSGSRAFLTPARANGSHRHGTARG